MQFDRESIQQHLVNYFSEYMLLTEKEKETIKKGMTIKLFKKGTQLLNPDTISKDCYFIYKGCLRQYYNIEGVEKTTNLYTENEWVFFQESVINKTPCGFYLTCVEDAILIVGNEEKEQELYSQFPKFASLSKTLLEEGFGNQQTMLTSFITETPEQRYLNLLKHKPDLIQRVPQYQIASYLGITPESLSRIRKRLFTKS